MKLRLKGNSIRFRLTQAEVAALHAGDVVHAQTRFSPDSVLACTIRSDAAVAELKTTFTGGEITLVIPMYAVQQWARSSQVSIDAEQRIEKDRTLHILIEKDFACLKPRDPDEDADAFPNPACIAEK